MNRVVLLLWLCDIAKSRHERLEHGKRFSRRGTQRGRAASKNFWIAEVRVFQDSVRLVAIKSHQENKKLQICIAGNVERIQRWAEVNQPSKPANFRTLIGVRVDGVVLQLNPFRITILNFELKARAALVLKIVWLNLVEALPQKNAARLPAASWEIMNFELLKWQYFEMLCV